jgi:hypothetical protein
VRGPDVTFIARERIPPDGLPPGFPRMAPDLAVEVVSPSSKAAEVQEKIKECAPCPAPSHPPIQSQGAGIPAGVPKSLPTRRCS